MDGGAVQLPVGEEGRSVCAVRLTLEILELLASGEGEMGLTKIANIISASKPSVVRHLSTLVERGYITRNPETSRYNWGPQLFFLGRQAPSRFDLIALAQPVMTAPRDQLDQTVVLAALSGNKLVVLATLGPRKQIEIGVRRGSIFPLERSAQDRIARLRDGELACGSPAAP